MEFINQYTLSDIIKSGLLLAAIFGIYFTYRQIKYSNKTQKATFFKELYLEFYSDENIKKAYYNIEYGKFEYDVNFHNSEQEKSLDQLLSLADLICYLRSKGLLSVDEMKSFEYRIHRICINENVLRYLDFLNLYFKLNNPGFIPFPNLKTYIDFSVID